MYYSLEFNEWTEKQPFTIQEDVLQNSWMFFRLVVLQSIKLIVWSRSSRSDVVCKKDVLRNFPNSQENTSAIVSFFNSFLKKRLWHKCFLVNFVKFLRAPFFIEYLWWLFIKIFEKIPVKRLNFSKVTATIAYSLEL